MAQPHNKSASSDSHKWFCREFLHWMFFLTHPWILPELRTGTGRLRIGPSCVISRMKEPMLASVHSRSWETNTCHAPSLHCCNNTRTFRNLFHLKVKWKRNYPNVIKLTLIFLPKTHNFVFIFYLPYDNRCNLALVLILAYLCFYYAKTSMICTVWLNSIKKKLNHVS